MAARGRTLFEQPDIQFKCFFFLFCHYFYFLWEKKRVHYMLMRPLKTF
jgi:hypothetical protein